MICGIPNAGKTTFSRRYEGVLHQDDIGTVRNVVDAIEEVEGDVVVEGYFGSAGERRRVLESRKGHSRCIFLDIPVEESIRREDRGRHPQVLRNAARFFEPPSYEEGWDEIEVVR